MSTSSGDARVLIGVHGGGFNGIDTYAEQVAVAAASVGRFVTLVATTEEVARDLECRLRDFDIHIIHLGLASDAGTSAADRLWPGRIRRRLAGALAATLQSHNVRYPIAHLNHPGLALAARLAASRVCVAAWFYPHSLTGRVAETWRHTGRAGTRRAVLTFKSVSHYLNDQAGYHSADCVITPTALLATHLNHRGIPAIACPPPVHLANESEGRNRNRGLPYRFILCSGDLSHPRKNVAAALRALRMIPASVGTVSVEAIGRNGHLLGKDVERLPAHISMTFPGPLPAHEVHRRMREADALLFPSLFEEWGYVAVEALLNGTPVVTLPVYPFAEMLQEGFGVRAASMTDEGYAEAILSLLALPPDPTLADRARKVFGAEAIGARLISIWSDLGREPVAGLSA
ncbi:MAG TPA: glycosyltransferase family 4 protein [Chloroflexota bacterium]|nr:glycosyltransferase family 4 protein [Chloroflexota bacterium]